MEFKFYQIPDNPTKPYKFPELDLKKPRLIKVKVERSIDGVVEKLIFSKKQFKKLFPGVNHVPTKHST